jgi:hypothetical protein
MTSTVATIVVAISTVEIAAETVVETGAVVDAGRAEADVAVAEDAPLADPVPGPVPDAIFRHRNTLRRKAETATSAATTPVDTTIADSTTAVRAVAASTVGRTIADSTTAGQAIHVVPPLPLAQHPAKTRSCSPASRLLNIVVAPPPRRRNLSLNTNPKKLSCPWRKRLLRNRAVLRRLAHPHRVHAASRADFPDGFWRMRVPKLNLRRQAPKSSLLLVSPPVTRRVPSHRSQAPGKPSKSPKPLAIPT